MNVRQKAFWTKDSLQGGRIQKCIKEITQINSLRDTYMIKAYQDERVKNLLRFTSENISYYKNNKVLSLSEIPVINKSVIKENLSDFCVSGKDSDRLYSMTTSGSTGTPFVSYQDSAKKARNTADTLYFGGLAGYFLGEPLFYFKIWSENNRKSRLLQFAQNIIPVDVLRLSDEHLAKILRDLQSQSGGAHLLGYSSAFDELGKYVQNQEVDRSLFNVRSIITMSEALVPATKKKLSDFFGVKVCSRYSNIENGILAQQTVENNDSFVVNRASYKIEVLRIDEDVEASPGEPGRIVVTDLYNYTMPFIRYDTGDIGMFKVGPDGVDEGVLSEIQGRKLDLLLDTRGEVISSYVVYKNMFKYPEIDQYQLVQEHAKKYSLNISMKGKLERENQIISEFKSYLGKDANVQINYLDQIPLLSSGKRRKIVNNYLKNRPQ